MTTEQQKTAPALDGDRAVSADPSEEGSAAIVAQTCHCGAEMQIRPPSQPDSTWTTATCPECPGWRFIILRQDDRPPHHRHQPEPRTTSDQLAWLDTYR